MKKVLFALTILFLVPFTVNAYEIETSFDQEKCELTVSGTQSGHEASVSYFNDNEEFLGMKTSSIDNGNFSVKFILKYESDTTINISVVNEKSENLTIKEDVGIPACQLTHQDEPQNPGQMILQLFDNNNSIIMKDNTVGFKDGDFFHLETFTDQDLLELLEQTVGTELHDYVEQVRNAVLQKLGDYKQFVSVLNVQLRNEHIRDEFDDPTDIDFSNYNGKFILKVYIPKEEYEAISGLNFAIYNPDNNSLSDPLFYEYDEVEQVLIFEIDRQCMLIAYIDVDYEFLDNTNNQTYDKKNGGSFRIRVDADINDYQKTLVDNNEVTNVEVTDGSTIVTFSPEYMNNLSVGEHEITVLFNNGHATTKLTVTNTSSAANPSTFDNIMTYINIIVISCIGLSICGYVLYRNKKVKKN